MTDEAWLDTVRLARDFGDVSQLYPPGIHELADLPHTLFDAIRSAAIFLSFEELPEDEQPPRRIWRDTEKLHAHFEDVRRARDRPADQRIDDPVQNQAALDLIVG